MYDDYVNGVLYSSHGKCSKCCRYSYDYAYGGLVILIGDREFLLNFSQTPEAQDGIRKLLTEAAKKEMENIKTSQEKKKG
jgi:hypothetical protein